MASTCKKCHAIIVWAVNPDTNRRVPLRSFSAVPAADRPENPIRYELKRVGADVHAIRNDDGPYLNHFQDCKGANEVNAEQKAKRAAGLGL